MILAWLEAKGLFGLARLWWVLIALAGLAAIWFGINGMLDRYGAASKELGATEQREADLTTTIERTEQGNDARDQIRNDAGSARYDECLRTARTPANCERFLPQRETDQR